ncbi:hypothetical protein AB1Y20_021714 [Prymnesium parvum]|uniref:Fe2OG dioxygenase domain-containing protein n=1 Tax=Prymnesium parvum TaxID=97485 RepID=A0AB34JL12_PRYPA
MAAIAWAELEAGGLDSAAAAAVCEQLHQRSYCVLRLPDHLAAELSALREGARAFFALPAKAKARVGAFRRIAETYVGYRDCADRDSEFLEMHLSPDGTAYPREELSPALLAASEAAHARLSRMARRLLAVLAAGLDLPPAAFLAPLDPEPLSRLPAGALSSSVLRLCHYRPRQAGAAGGDVLFDEHTDSTLLTLSPLCPEAAGLELRDAEARWVRIEEAEGVTPLHLGVHVGDFLSFLTRDFYPASSHRVVRPAGGASRLSFPFLVRPRNEHELDTRAYDPEGTHPQLPEVHAIRCAELRKLFDVRGQRVVRELREREAREEERKARAKAFREAVLAGRRPVAASDESDGEGSGGARGEAAGQSCASPPPQEAGEAGGGTRGRGGGEGRGEGGGEGGAASAARGGGSKWKKELKAAKKAAAKARAAEKAGGARVAAAAAPTGEAPPAAGVRARWREEAEAMEARRREAFDAAAGGEAEGRVAQWRLHDVAVLLLSDEYLFAYKQHDLHMDHPTVGVTLQTQLCAALPHLADPKTVHGFRNVHQLDYATSGVLCFGLSKRAAGTAGRLFEARRVRKWYLALVEGHVPWSERREERGVGKDASDPREFRMAVEGSEHCVAPLAACTELYVIGRGALADRPVSKLLLCPLTGRRHQLRLHCAVLGHPIVGDFAYTADRTAPRMMLHAWRLQLPLPQKTVVVGTMDPFPATLEPSAMATGGEVLPTEGPAVFEVTCELDAQSCVHELRGGANSTKHAEDGVPMDVEYNFIAGCDRRHVGPHDSERIGEQVGSH